MEVTCHHCEHKWDYTGERKYRTCCPDCGYQTYLNKDKEIPSKKKKQKAK